jgi:hypothetical protein
MPSQILRNSSNALGPGVMAVFCTRLHDVLHASRASAPILESKCPHPTKISPTNSLSVPLLSSLHKGLTFLKRTSSRRANEHCLGTFKRKKYFCGPQKCSLCFFAPFPRNYFFSIPFSDLRRIIITIIITIIIIIIGII